MQNFHKLRKLYKSDKNNANVISRAETGLKELERRGNIINSSMAGNVILYRALGSVDKFERVTNPSNLWLWDKYEYMVEERPEVIPWDKYTFWKTINLDTDFIDVDTNEVFKIHSIVHHKLKHGRIETGKDMLEVTFVNIDEGGFWDTEYCIDMVTLADSFDYIDKEGNRKPCGFLMEEVKE